MPYFASQGNRLRSRFWWRQDVDVIPGMQFDGLPVLGDRHHALEDALRVLAKPVGERLRKEEWRFLVRDRSGFDEYPQPAAHVVHGDLQLGFAVAAVAFHVITPTAR